MKRKPIARTRPRPRRTTAPRCERQRCGKRAVNVTEDMQRLCKSHLVKEADRLMSLAVRTEVGRCQSCGDSTRLQWAHVHSRRYMAIRWDRENSTCLCAPCHAFYTHKPLEWEDWCRREGIPWDTLRERALTLPPMDPISVIAEVRRSHG